MNAAVAGERIPVADNRKKKPLPAADDRNQKSATIIQQSNYHLLLLPTHILEQERFIPCMNHPASGDSAGGILLRDKIPEPAGWRSLFCQT